MKQTSVHFEMGELAFYFRTSIHLLFHVRRDNVYSITVQTASISLGWFGAPLAPHPIKHQSNSNFLSVSHALNWKSKWLCEMAYELLLFYGPIYPDIVSYRSDEEMLYTYWAYSLIGERANLNRCKKHQVCLVVCLRAFCFPLIRISIACDVYR